QMTVTDNPYLAPMPLSDESSPVEIRKRPIWPSVVAILWVTIFFFGLPLVVSPRHLSPPGTFLWLKLITTSISVMAGIVLATIPRRVWLFATIPIILLLAFVQYTAWVLLP
ncbi:MAG: hypothetical protein ACK557_03885, partial [Planctomycetota bacterium]